MSDFDISGLTDMLGGFGARLEQMKADAASTRVTGQAGGGLVEVTATGDNQITGIVISDDAMTDRELLQDLVRAATNEALRRAQEEAAAKLSQLTAGLPLPPGMLDR